MDTSQQKTGAPPAPGSARRAFALRFISGKYQGGEFPIYPDKPIVVGRSSDLDMVLVEDMVSRRHAKIALAADNTITIEDLGSTNGTFVNGEKVKKARPKEGDRELIGTSILKVAAADSNAQQQGDAKANLENVAAARRTSQVQRAAATFSRLALASPCCCAFESAAATLRMLVPISSRSPSLGRAFLTFSPLTNVPFVDPRSSIVIVLSAASAIFA